MSLIQRDFVGNGDFIRESIEFGSVTSTTVVVGSITELDGDDRPQVGNATVELHNIAAHDGVVDFIAAVLWDSPLRYRISLAIFD